MPPTQPPSLLRSSGLLRLEASPLPVNRWDGLLLPSIRMRELGSLRDRNAPLAGNVEAILLGGSEPVNSAQGCLPTSGRRP